MKEEDVIALVVLEELVYREIHRKMRFYCSKRPLLLLLPLRLFHMKIWMMREVNEQIRHVGEERIVMRPLLKKLVVVHRQQHLQHPHQHRQSQEEQQVAEVVALSAQGLLLEEELEEEEVVVRAAVVIQ